jgi:hypothetical protein
MKKKAAKTSPIGVRFNIDKLELVKSENNIATPQKVVDFFLDGYEPKKEKAEPIITKTTESAMSRLDALRKIKKK